MNRLNKILLTALSAVYVILSILPIQQCSVSNELFIYNCPQSKTAEISIQTETESCCEVTPCCRKVVKSSEIDHYLTFQEESLKLVFNIQNLAQFLELESTHRSFYIWPRPYESIYIHPDKYILYQSFLC